MREQFTIFVILFGLTILNSAAFESCSSNEFQCVDGQRCLLNSFVCDGNPNCQDESDEDPQICETWEYEYEEEDGGGGGWFGWGGGGDEEEVDYEEPKEDVVDEGETDPEEGILHEYEEKGYDEDLTLKISDDLSEDDDNGDDFTSTKRCSLNQCSPRGPLNFVDGNEYHYFYTSESTTQAFREGSTQSSIMIIECDVILQAVTACEMKIKLENVVQKSSTPNHDIVDADVKFLQALEKESLRFSMMGGEIDSICPSSEEDSRTLNFKKGIISMIQNTMPQLHISHSQIEKEIVGECEMNYHFEGANGVQVTVSKSRNLNSCRSRSHLSNAAQGVPYSFPLETNPLPVIETESECRQSIERGIIRKANCFETHVLTPFNMDHGGIRTSIAQNLSFTSQTFFFLRSEQPIYRRTDLLFDHHVHQGNSKKNHNDNKEAINALLDRIDELNSFQLKMSKDDVSNDSPSRLFERLVRVLAEASAKELEEIYQSRHWADVDRRYFHDGVSMAGTAASLRFMAKQIPSVLDTSLISSWVSSIALIQSPDIGVISALSDILRVNNAPNELFLSAGSLLNTYCLHHRSCENHRPVKEAMNFFRESIQSKCRTETQEQKLQMLIALRGIGNAGLATNDAITSALNACILDEDNEVEIRATAIEAFKKVPCHGSRSSLKKVFINQSTDSELRILSYLGLMRCPDYSLIQMIDKLFEREEVNQVGSFVWTHLTNLQESSIPSKLEIQSLLSNRKFEEKFKPDFRKFSKNMELSGFYDAMNIGASLESNIIFSQKSFIPRQISLNLTADLFGRSFNFFEGGVRIEGFEKYIERLIRGDIKEASPTNINSFSIQNRMKTSWKELHRKTEPEMSLHMKTFGNDFMYEHLNSMEEIASKFKKFTINEIMKSLKDGKEFTLKKSALPLDSMYTLPTTTGLPLRITVEGSASVDASASLQIDVSALREGRGMLRGHLKPSFSVDLRASMVVEGYSSQTGVEMESSLSSSTIVDGKLEIDQNNAVRVDFNLPQQKVDIFRTSAKLSLIHGMNNIGYNDDERPQQNREIVLHPNVASVTNECLPFKNMFGLIFCWSKSHPDTSKSPLSHKILLNGPVAFSSDLTKTDPTLFSYKFRYEWKNDNEKLLFYLLYDTPGSTVNRKSSFNFIVNYATSNIQVSFQSPVASMNIKGNYIFNADVKLLNASVDFNNQHFASLDVGYKIHERSGQRILIPIFQINWKTIQLLKITGTLETRERDRARDLVHYGVDLQFEVDLTGTGDKGKRGTGVIGGFISTESSSWEADLQASYSFSGTNIRENISFYYKKIMHISDPLLKVVRSWRVSFSQFPHLNTKGKWASKSYHGSIEDSVQASFGRNYKNIDHQVDLYRNLIFYGGNHHTTINATVAIKYPVKNLDIVMGVDFYDDIRDTNTGFLFQYSAGKMIKSRFHLVRSFIENFSIEGSYYLLVPQWINLVMKGEVKETAIQTYEFHFSGSMDPSSRLEVAGHYRDLSSRLKHLHQVEMKIKLPSRDVVYSNSTILYDTSQIVVATQIKTKDGSKYKLRVAHIINYHGSYANQQRQIEVDLNLPGRNYYWHSFISFGHYITISNDIHLDSFRDISLSLQIQRQRLNNPTSIEVKLLWDANRDPHKKAHFEMTLGDQFTHLTSVISFLGNEYRGIWKSSRDWATNENRLTFWSHVHACELSWTDDKRLTHKIAFGGSFNFTKNEGANLAAETYLRTPLENWKDNSVYINYDRSASQIAVSLKSKWHRDEFLNLNFNLGTQKTENSLKGECLVEILSFINDNMVTLSTGAVIIKSKGSLDGKIFLKWDKDEVQLLVNAMDSSGPNNLRGSILAKALTTLPGYGRLAVFAELDATSTSITLIGNTKWEDILYEVKFKGDLYSAKEYLKGEISLTTPQFGPDTALAKIRVFHDYETHEERLMVLGHWLNQKVTLNGRILTEPEDFQAELNLITPFVKLSQLSLSLGHATKEFHMTELWIKWNNTNDLGVRIISRLISLGDFVMSATLKTPFQKYKEVKAELRNLFKLTPTVQVNSRIFGQMDAKKYGLGGRYEQGHSPKLHVGLEMYYPIPGLQEVKFDIADNSTLTNMRYSFEMKHGIKRHMAIHTDFARTERSVAFSFASKTTLASVFGPEFEEISLEGKADFSWNPNTDFDLRLATTTMSDTYKIFAKGRLTPDRSGRMEGNFALPFASLDDIGYELDYQAPKYDDNGYLKVRLVSGAYPIFTLDLEGKLRVVSLSFTAPTAIAEQFREGHLRYKLIPLDVVKSTVTGSASLGDSHVTFNGYVFLNEDNYVTKSEVAGITPFKGIGEVKLTIEGHTESDGGFKSLLHIEANAASYEGEVSYRVTDSEQKWMLHAKAYDKVKNETKTFEGEVFYDSHRGNSQTFGFRLVNTEHQIYSTSIATKFQEKPYETLVEWNIPENQGKIEIIFTNFENERILGTVIVTLENPADEPAETFKLKADLHNRSTRDEVNLVLFNEITSTHPQWDYILIDGSLKQVTSEPGLLQVYLIWPEMNPVNFTAMARYSGVPALDIRTNVHLNLTTANYGFLGEVKGENQNLNLNGGIWWQKEKSTQVEKIHLVSTFKFFGGNIVGTSTLYLPMVEGYELNKAHVKYRIVHKYREFSVTVETGGSNTTFTSFLRPHQFPAAEGNASLSSSVFKEGQPLTITFDQDLTPDGYTGEYQLEWPTFDLKTNSYEREYVKAILNHTNLDRGQEGILKLISPLTKGKPISFTYHFQFPKKPDVIIKFGVGYEKLKLEVKGSHIVRRTTTQQTRETSVELDNLIWPFGIAYFETISLRSPDGEETNDRLIIYDLENKNRRSSLSFDRKITNQGARIALKGILVEREIELSAGYKSLPHHLRGDIIVSWSRDEKIVCQLDWNDEEKPTLEAQIAHPFRTLSLKTIYGWVSEGFSADLTLNADLNNPDNVPLTASMLYYKHLHQERDEKESKVSLSISHPSLESDILCLGVFRNSKAQPLHLTFDFSYSSKPEKNLHLKALVERNDQDRKITDLFELIHKASNLLTKANGTLRYGDRGYFFEQDLVYMTLEGEKRTAKIDGGFDIQTETLHTLVESSERIFDLKMELQQKENDRWELLTTSETVGVFPMKASLYLHPAQPVFNLTIESLKNDSFKEEKQIVPMVGDLDYPRYEAEKIVLDGGLEDQRFVHFSLRHFLPQRKTNPPHFWIQDVDFYFKLNNSKLVVSHFDWRKQIEEEIRNEINALMGVTHELRDSTKEWLKKAVLILGIEAVNRTKPILADASAAVKPLFHHFKYEFDGFKNDFYLLLRSINMTKKEKDLKASLEFAVGNIAKSLNETALAKKIKGVLAKGTLRIHITRFIQKVKDFLAKIFEKDSTRAGLIEIVKKLASSFASAYDNAAKKMYLLLRNTMGDFKMRLTEWLRNKWHSLYYNYKPHIFRTIHHIETATYSIVSHLWETMNTLGENFKSLSYVQSLEEIYRKVKSLYEEMSEKSLRQNLESIYQYVTSYIEKGVELFFARILPFIKDWLNEIKKAWVKFASYEKIGIAIDFCYNLMQTVYWVLSKVDYSEHFIDATAFSLEHGYTIMTQKTTETQLKGIKAKTDMTWEPEKGRIRLVQKLPFVWNAFNQKPELKGLFELPYISPVLFPLLFPSNKFSVLDSWYRYFNLNFDPSTWIPPFTATSYLVGEDNILTFDGQLIRYKGTCEHLLAADLPYSRWAITIKYNMYTPKIINVYIDGKVVELSKQFKVKIDGDLVGVPYMMESAFVWRTDAAVHFTHRDEMEIIWNLVHDVVSVKMPREAFMSTAGILGTNNNEPSDDLLMPSGVVWSDPKDVREFFESWKVNEPCRSEQRATSLEVPETSPLCRELFLSKISPFRYCFYQADPRPYYKMCLNAFKGSFGDSSAIALAYREKCQESAVPIKLPAYYVSCFYFDAKGQERRLEEGQSVVLKRGEIENVVDVVLLVELKSCNKKKLHTKPFQKFINMFSEGMKKEGVTSIRFAVVAFGGTGHNWKPSVVSSDAEIFTSVKNVAKLTENLNFESGNEFENTSRGDGAFPAITYASNLPFRAPGSLVLVLFPCSPCPEAHGFDYSTMYHILFNNAATLYVFKNNYFDIEKQSIRKKIVGYDKEKAFVLKDYKKKKMGDEALKNQIQPPKSELNYCLPLAIETNGAVFSSQLLLKGSKKKIERLGLATGRRAGQNTKKEYDQRCLCLSTQEVTPLLRCDPWENGDFSVLQRYGLDIGSESPVFENFESDQREGFYRND